VIQCKPTRPKLRKITGNTPDDQLSWDAPLVLDGTAVWDCGSSIVGLHGRFDHHQQCRTPCTPCRLNIPTDNFIDQALVIAGFYRSM